MKKILFLLSLTAFMFTVVPAVTHSNEANAQLVTVLTPTAVNDTLTNADTAWIYISATVAGSVTTAVADNISRSVEFLFTRLSGTAAGSFTLEGTIDGTNWVSISTDVLTNIVTNIKVYSMRNSVGDLQFKQYRGVIITSGTVTGIPKLHYLRRSN